MKINTLVDNLISDVVESLVQSQSQTQPIPDLVKKFKVLFVKGGLEATRGVFSDLSTVQRTGDATLALHSDHASIKISLGLTNMELYFEHCRAWLGALSSSEKIAVYIENNSLEVDVTLHIQGETCTTTLDNVSLTQFHDIKVDLKSLGIIKYVAAHFVDWIIDEFDGKIRRSVEAQLQDVIQQELYKVDFCSLL